MTDAKNAMAELVSTPSQRVYIAIMLNATLNITLFKHTMLTWYFLTMFSWHFFDVQISFWKRYLNSSVV